MEYREMLKIIKDVNWYLGYFRWSHHLGKNDASVDIRTEKYYTSYIVNSFYGGRPSSEIPSAREILLETGTEDQIQKLRLLENTLWTEKKNVLLGGSSSLTILGI